MAAMGLSSTALGDTDFTSGSQTYLGAGFDHNQGVQDIVFRYTTAGGVLYAGFVEYGNVEGPSLDSADFDNDGDIDGADFLTWQRGFGMSSPTHANGDANGDGKLTREEMHAVRSADREQRRAQAEERYRNADKNGDGVISQEEAQAGMPQAAQHFGEIDQDGNGYADDVIGYDFVNSGFAGRAWPDWMKYFSFAMDLTYNKLEVNTHAGPLRIPDQKLDGYEVAWTFLFMAHYGFMPDSEVPSGRIVPYIGVGPAILWSGIENPVTNGSANAVNVALIVEPGIRWMALPNVSIDTAMRYRYAAPSYDLGSNATLTLDSLHQFAFLLRANYHF